PGLADRVRALPARLHAGSEWAERLLTELARGYLAVSAWRRRDVLPDDALADLRVVLGWPRRVDEVLERGERVTDRWAVLGLAQETDSRLQSQRTWLHGQRSGRTVVVLDFAAAGATLAVAEVLGSVVEAEVALYPGSDPRRALFTGERSVAAAAGDGHRRRPRPGGRVAGRQPVRRAVPAGPGRGRPGRRRSPPSRRRTGRRFPAAVRRDRPPAVAGPVRRPPRRPLRRMGRVLPDAAQRRGRGRPGGPVTGEAPFPGPPSSAAAPPVGEAPFPGPSSADAAPPVGEAPFPGPSSADAAPPVGEAWEAVLSAALVGTARRGAPSVAAEMVAALTGAGPRPHRRATAAASTGEERRSDGDGAGPDPAGVLLAAAAVLSSYRRAGRRPGEAPRALPVPAGADDRPACPKPAVEVLELILTGEVPIPGGATPLVAEWVAGAARAGCRLPARLLPRLLDLGSSSPDLQPGLRAAAGPRGRWLA